jgi:hypothetical protein
MSAASVGKNSGQAKRGIWLVIFLVLSVLSSIGSFLLGAIWLNDFFSYSEEVRALSAVNFTVVGSMLIVAGIMGIVSVVGVFMWKRWGYFGLFLVQILTMIALYMQSGDFSSLIAPIVWAAIFFFLLRNKTQNLS